MIYEAYIELRKELKDNIKQQTNTKAKLLYQFFEKSKGYKPFVEDKTIRSQTVITAEVENSQELTRKLAEEGLIVDSGYGPFKGKQVRIANFPAVNLQQIKMHFLYHLLINK